MTAHTHAIIILTGFILGICTIITSAYILMSAHWTPGEQQFTRLPELEQQHPSITVYASR